MAQPGGLAEEHHERLRELAERMKAYTSRKADLQAAADMVQKGQAVPLRHGTIEGVPPGTTLTGRASLMVLGIHGHYYTGISAPPVGGRREDEFAEHPDLSAFAVALNGGYEEDEDSGAEFTYTGVGLKPRQEWKVGNYALMQSWATGTPVRVVRCEKQKGSSPRYHFDGCYRITAAYTNCYQFKDRPPIYPLRDNAYRRCMFRLEAIPGLAVAKPVAQVVFSKARHHHVAMRAALPARRTLVAKKDGDRKRGREEGGSGRGRKRRAVGDRKAGKEEAEDGEGSDEGAGVDGEGEETRVVGRRALGRAARERKGLLCEDITGGLEKVPIPAFNEVDDEPFPTFTYIPVCCWSDEAAAMLRQLKPYVGSRGTCARAKWEELCRGTSVSMPYRGGLLTEAGTEVLPMECGPQCGARRACQGTRHLSRGVQLPLEVCKTKGKGWGVRCAQAIPIGKCICEYVGMLRSEEEPDAMQARAKMQGEPGSIDAYIFTLNSYVIAKRWEEALNVIEGQAVEDEHVRALVERARKARKWDGVRGAMAAVDGEETRLAAAEAVQRTGGLFQRRHATGPGEGGKGGVGGEGGEGGKRGAGGAGGRGVVAGAVGDVGAEADVELDMNMDCLSFDGVSADGLFGGGPCGLEPASDGNGEMRGDVEGGAKMGGEVDGNGEMHGEADGNGKMGGEADGVAGAEVVAGADADAGVDVRAGPVLGKESPETVSVNFGQQGAREAGGDGLCAGDGEDQVKTEEGDRKGPLSVAVVAAEGQGVQAAAGVGGVQAEGVGGGRTEGVGGCEEKAGAGGKCEERVKATQTDKAGVGQAEGAGVGQKSEGAGQGNGAGACEGREGAGQAGAFGRAESTGGVARPRPGDVARAFEQTSSGTESDSSSDIEIVPMKPRHFIRREGGSGTLPGPKGGSEGGAKSEGGVAGARRGAKAGQGAKGAGGRGGRGRGRGRGRRKGAGWDSDNDSSGSANDESSMEEEEVVDGEECAPYHVDVLRILAELPEALQATMVEHFALLCVDAKDYGNVARFTNHSCDPNCVVQAVITPECNKVFYRLGIFASRDIPAMEELTYDYNYTAEAMERVMGGCRCGAPNCMHRSKQGQA